VITFLEFCGRGMRLSSRREPLDRNKLQCEINIDIHCLAERKKDTCMRSFAKPQGQRLMITKTQGVLSSRVGVT
jgi:hypothetical protein